jgi:N-methylhydantoinase B
VYGVVLADGGIDSEATAARRLEHRRARLDGAEPGDPVAAPAGAHPVGELLHVVDGRWWCNGADLGPIEANYKPAAVLREVRAREIAPEFDAADHDMADRIVFREWICPVTGYRIDTELARVGEPAFEDILLFSDPGR